MNNEKGESINRVDAESACICRSCPTYFDCEEKLAFCLYDEGASDCIVVNRGCICPSCSVYMAAGFEFDLYCIAGSEKAQNDSKETMDT